MHPFGRAEIFRFRHMLVALVEELKLLKRCDADSAAKIQDLVNKNHFLQRSKESEQQKARLKEEALEQAMRELRQQYEDKLKRHETDQQQRVIRNECNEFIESKIMDEMRQLQITVYHQEKTIKELEAKAQSQEHSADKTLTQWVTVESKMTSLHETYQITLESVDRLDKNVAKAVDLNRKLAYQNKHNTCVTKDKDFEISKLQEQLLKAKVEMSSRSVEASQDGEMREIIDKQRLKIKGLQEQNEALSKELEWQAENAKQAMADVQAAHTLINKHTENANMNRAEADQKAKENDELLARLSHLTEQLNSTQQELESQAVAWKTESEKWKEKESQLQEDVRVNSHQLQSLEETKIRLEDLNSHLSQRNEELLKCLSDANAKLNVLRSDQCIQTGCSTYSYIDRHVQVSPDMTVTAVQFSGPDMKHEITQTDSASTLSIFIQTEQAETSCSSSQTPVRVLVNNNSGQTYGLDTVNKHTQTIPTTDTTERVTEEVVAAAAREAIHASAHQMHPSPLLKIEITAGPEGDLSAPVSTESDNTVKSHLDQARNAGNLAIHANSTSCTWAEWSGTQPGMQKNGKHSKANDLPVKFVTINSSNKNSSNVGMDSVIDAPQAFDQYEKIPQDDASCVDGNDPGKDNFEQVKVKRRDTTDICRFPCMRVGDGMQGNMLDVSKVINDSSIFSRSTCNDCQTTDNIQREHSASDETLSFHTSSCHSGCSEGQQSDRKIAVNLVASHDKHKNGWKSTSSDLFTGSSRALRKSSTSNDLQIKSDSRKEFSPMMGVNTAAFLQSNQQSVHTDKSEKSKKLVDCNWKSCEETGAGRDSMSDQSDNILHLKKASYSLKLSKANGKPSSKSSCSYAASVPPLTESTILASSATQHVKGQPIVRERQDSFSSRGKLQIKPHTKSLTDQISARQDNGSFINTQEVLEKQTAACSDDGSGKQISSGQNESHGSKNHRSLTQQHSNQSKINPFSFKEQRPNQSRVNQECLTLKYFEQSRMKQQSLMSQSKENLQSHTQQHLNQNNVNQQCIPQQNSDEIGVPQQSIKQQTPAQMLNVQLHKKLKKPPGSRHKNATRPLLFLPSKYIESPSPVAGSSISFKIADRKLKGILREPLSRNVKADVPKSVSFPEELESYLHGLTPSSQDSQLFSTISQSHGCPVSLESNTVNSKSATKHPVDTSFKYPASGLNRRNNTVLRDCGTDINPNGAGCPNSADNKFKCPSVPETPNLDVKDHETDISCDAGQVGVGLESSKPILDLQSSKLCEKQAKDEPEEPSVSTTEASYPVLKKRKTF